MSELRVGGDTRLQITSHCLLGDRVPSVSVPLSEAGDNELPCSALAFVFLY